LAEFGSRKKKTAEGGKDKNKVTLKTDLFEVGDIFRGDLREKKSSCNELKREEPILPWGEIGSRLSL